MVEGIVVRMNFGNLEEGFFLYQGKPYFAMKYGRFTFPFLVEGGKIKRVSRVDISPCEEIEIILPEDMRAYGLDIARRDNPLDERFWDIAAE